MKGTYNYTIGQRKGLGIAAAEPLYVVAVERERAPSGHRDGRRRLRWSASGWRP